MITIINYGSGNIKAIANIYELLKIPFSVASKPFQLEEADRIILPGVGSFDYCVEKLNNSGLKEILNRKKLDINLIKKTINKQKILFKGTSGLGLNFLILKKND